MPNPDLFTYIAPNDDTAARYQRIRLAEGECATELAEHIHSHHTKLSYRYELISAACKRMHDELVAVCPSSADLSAAIRCVRLARMAANEAVTVPHARSRFARMAEEQLTLARWQACAAVALALPAELPPLT